MSSGQIAIPQSENEAQSTRSGEIERRKKLLEEYKAATNASNKRIYEARNSGIHKPQFYAWVNGTLAADIILAVSR